MLGARDRGGRSATSQTGAFPSATWERGKLKSWHDYAANELRAKAPLEGPAGVNVTYMDSTHLKVSCYPVYGASKYAIASKVLNATPSTWVDGGIGCDPSTTGCTILVDTSTEYAVKLGAQNSDGSITANSYAALFLSEPENDGYIKYRPSLNAYMNHPNDSPEPGILAGEPSGSALLHDKVFSPFTPAPWGRSTCSERSCV
jgi:hypothetical protein